MAGGQEEKISTVKVDTSQQRLRCEYQAQNQKGSDLFIFGTNLTMKTKNQYDPL